MKGSELERESCFSCGAEVPKSDGPVHKYIDSSPGCWAAFGEVLARECSDFRHEGASEARPVGWTSESGCS